MIKKFKNKIKLIVSGLIIGVINGFFGGGGGMICVPILENVLFLNNKEAHATALSVMFPLCLASGITYLFNVNMEWNSFAFVCAGFVVGGVVGAFLLKKLNNVVVRAVFVLVVFASGIKMVI